MNVSSEALALSSSSTSLITSGSSTSSVLSSAASSSSRPTLTPDSSYKRPNRGEMTDAPEIKKVFEELAEPSTSVAAALQGIGMICCYLS